MSSNYLQSLEKRIATIEKWQKIELIMLAAIIGEKVLDLLLPIIG